jgi:hypothetical protein
VIEFYLNNTKQSAQEEPDKLWREPGMESRKKKEKKRMIKKISSKHYNN